MQNELILDFKDINTKSLAEYKKKYTWLTCFLSDRSNDEPFLKENGFKYMGRRWVGGDLMVVFSWKEDMNGFEEMDIFFDNRAMDYDETMKTVDYYEKSLIDLIAHFNKTNDEVKILDLGCGTGTELELVFEKAPNARIVCIDLSQIIWINWKKSLI